MPPMHTLVEEQLDDIVFDGNNKKPTRKLVAATATLALVIDISAQVDVAAGGGADGAVNTEHVARLVKRLRVFDGNNNPVVDAEPRELIQISDRRGMNPHSGLALAGPGIQAATLIREQFTIPLSDPWSANPYEVHLRPRDPDKFKIEIEWAAQEAIGLANGALAAVLITGGTRSVVVTNLTVRVMQVHDPIAALKQMPIFMPRIVSYDKDVPGVSAAFPFEVETSRHVRLALIHAMNNDVTSETLINKLSLKDDQRTYRNTIPARSWHEREQWKFGGVQDVVGVDLGYFMVDFADNGRLGNIMAPKQGGNPKWVFDVTGGANRIIRLVHVELERVPGYTLPDDQLPAGLK